MASPDDWSRVGHAGNPVTGNPAVIDGIAKELRGLGDLAGRVDAGLDALLLKAENGGFEGKTADALRNYVKNELKTFMANVTRSFELAASAVARYGNALKDSRARAESTTEKVSALELTPDDPELATARKDVDAEVGHIEAEAKILEDALRDAADMVSRPIKSPKKSFWKRFVANFFKALEILTMIITIAAAILTGPLGLIAFGLGAVLFVKALVDYAMGNGSALGLGMAFLGILFPSTKGLTTIGGLARMASAGGRLAGRALTAGGRLLLTGGRLLSSPRTLLALAGMGLARGAGAMSGLGGRVFGGLSRLPRLATRGPQMLAAAIRFIPGFSRGVFQQARFALRRDFFMSTAFVSGSTGKRLGVYAIINTGRALDFAVSAILPLRYAELASLGYRGAFRAGILERGLLRPAQGVTALTRAGATGADLAALTGRGLTEPGALRPLDDLTAGKLLVPGTEAWDRALGDLTETMARRVATPGAPGISSLESLDRAGLPVGSRGVLTALDDLDGFGAPALPGARSALLSPPNAVARLQDLDSLTGLERTAAGLLKPMDDLEDLADLALFSIDGRFGGLGEAQLGKILDGEIDLVNVTPDGVILRIGKTDPVDVLVQLNDEITVKVINTADDAGTAVPHPSWTAATGPGRLTDLGIELDDLSRLVPNHTDGIRTTRELFGLGPARTDLAAAPVTVKPSSPPLTLREIVTGGATGKLATDRFQAWIRTQSAQARLDLAGGKLTELGDLGEVEPLRLAETELDLSAAQLEFNRTRGAFGRLGMNLDTVRQDITVMMARTDIPAMPTGPVRLDWLGAPLPQSELRLLDPGRSTGLRVEWESTPRAGGGVTLTDVMGDVRLQFDARDVLEFRDMRIPGVDGFLRFDAVPGMGSLPRVVGPDEVPPAVTGVAVDPVRGALGVVTGVDVRRLDGAWTARFDLDGTRLSEDVALTGAPAGPLAGARVTTTFTQVPGGGTLPSVRLTGPGVGDGLFTVRPVSGDLAGLAPRGFTVTDTLTGTRYTFDGAGQLRFRDVRVAETDGSGFWRFPEGTDGLPVRLDAAGMPVPEARAAGQPPLILQDLRLDSLGSLDVPDVLDSGIADALRTGRLQGPDAFDPRESPDVTVGEVSLSGIDERTQFDPMGRLEFRDLPLPGTDFALRFTDDALHPMPRVVGPDGAPVTGGVIAPLRDASGTLTGLDVRVPMAGTHDLTAVWRFDPGGVLRRQELPLTFPGLDGPSGLAMRVTVTPGTGGTTARLVELTGPSHLVASFRLTPTDGPLAGRLPNGFTVTDTVTGSRFHFDHTGRPAFRDLPARDGSGFVRFTEGAHTLDEAAGMRAVPDSVPDSLPAALPDAADLQLSRLSGLSDLSDIDLAAVRATLDEHWQVLEPLHRVPLSGVDELAGLDVRLVHVPASETTPLGTVRLELAERAPGGAGPVRGPDLTVELLDDTGRFAVTDPAGHARFTFAHDGGFLGRESALTGEGLPEGLRLQVTVGAETDGAPRTMVDLLGPPGALGSVRLTPLEGPLAERLPGGFTVTDTVTGSRFHFDLSGNLVLRDLPARDGSGFVRFTEGAAPGTAPTRLVESLDEAFPLHSIPENGVPHELVTDLGEMGQIFDRTLDEAAGLRTLPAGPAADLSGIAGAMDLLRVAPDSHAFQTLDLPRVQQLTAQAADSLNRMGLSPDLLNDQLRQMTAQARTALRQDAVTTLRDYLDLPLPTRLDDLQSVAGGAPGRVIGDFTVTPTPHGGPGGSRYTVLHNPTDLTTGFGPNRELLYQEVRLSGGPEGLGGLKLGFTGHSAEFVGPRPADHLFTVDIAPRGGFTVTDVHGASWHYGTEGVLALRDVRLPGGRGVFRFDAGAPGGVPHLLDTAGSPLPAVRAEFLDDGRIAVIPTGKGAHPLERTVFDPSGTLLDETIAIRGAGGRPAGEFWRIDHVAGTAVRTDSAGTELPGRFGSVTVGKSGTGQFRLTTVGKVTVFEREVLRNGNTVHIDLDRFGRARWTEFDSAGGRFRQGERIGDADQRTFHDVPGGTWLRLNTTDVRTYTRAADGGLVRAEKGADGHWTWQRFDKDGAEALSGTRHWSLNHVAFNDTFTDPVTGLETVAQHRAQTWPFGGLHGSRMYTEHAVVPGEFPAGGRIDPGAHTGIGPANAQIQSLEALSDGGSLLVERFADMRPPAFLWKSAAGRNPFDGFFRDLFAGDSLHRVSHWTQIAADGTKMTGVRLNPSGSNWVDIDRFGRVVRETRKLDNGNVIEVGRSLEDPTRWAPVPGYRKGGSYELSWRDTTGDVQGTRHVDGYGRWRDLFTDDQGVERVRLRSEGTGTREYVLDAPSTADLALHDSTGLWVDKNSLLHITGRRDLIGGRIVESSGSPYRTSWHWKAYDPAEPGTVVAEGVRKQNRGSFYSMTWDDSFVDLDRLGNPVRERNATDTASSWVDAVKQPDGGWTWTRTAADGTVHSEGVRVYDDPARGRWRDLVNDQVVRRRDGGRVREYQYEVTAYEPPAPAAALPGEAGGRVTMFDLLAQSARHFEPPNTVRVDPRVWKEYDLGKVFRERTAVPGMPGRFRETDKQWGQWREFQDGHLVEQRTFTGRVWKTDPFGRWGTSGPASIPEYLAGALPPVRGEVGLTGDRAWQLTGRETDFRGHDIEALGLLREVQDPWHAVFTGVRAGESTEMPVWARELRNLATTFTTGFVTDFTAGLVVTAITQNGDVSPLDVYKALLNGTVGGTFSGGLNLLYNRTPLGYFKTSMGARDWGAHPKQSMAGNTDDWATDWAAQEKPTRWRNATYANTVGLATGALSGFVSNAISAAVFGVNGNEVKGADALLAGGWGAASSLFSGVGTGMARSIFHTTTGARVFHKGGVGDLGLTWSESFLTRYINYWITQQGGSGLPSPGRAFPAPAPATPSTTATDQQELP